MKKNNKKNEDEKSVKEYLKIIDAYYSTQGYNKLWNYFLEIVKSNYFQNKIRTLRKQCKIPPKGFNSKEDEMRLSNRNAQELKEESNVDVSEEILKLCEKYSLHFLDWSDVISEYLYYNKIEPIYNINSSNLCLLGNTIEEKKDPFNKEIQKADDIAYPIVIRISPYASLRDILDFTKKVYKVAIKPAQEHYKDKNIKIGKIKSKNQSIQKRNQFIYDNRDLPRKKIKELVSDKFKIDLDYEYVGKIISEEKKRRKKL